MYKAVVCHYKCSDATMAGLQKDKDKQGGRGYLLTPPESSAKRLWRASSSPKAVKQLLTTDAR